MSFDGITTNVVVNELKNTLIQSRIEKIYVPNKNEIILSLHTQNRKNCKLLISIDANTSRFHLTNATRENPEKAPQFCMILRKYLQSGKILDIKQENLDRIITISIENINDFGDYETKHLIIELMGKYSNIILIDDNQNVLDSMRHVTAFMSSVREVLPGKKYILPTSLGKINFLETSFEDFKNSLPGDANLIDGLSNSFTGFSRSFAEAITQKLNISKDEIVSRLTIEDLKKAYKYILSLLKDIKDKNINFKISENKKDYNIDFENFDLSKSVSEFLDEFYDGKEKISILKNAKQNLERDVNQNLNKLKKKLSLANEILADEEKLETLKQYGELISSNIYKMQIGMDKLVTENFYDNCNVVEIPLQSNLSPSRNAQNYFKKYNKLKNSLVHAKEHKEIYDKDISYLESVIYSLNEATSLNEVDDIREELISSEVIKKPGKRYKRRDLPSEPFKYEKNGIEILVGRNNVQNDKLTFKIARKTDTWLHTKDIHGSHVIIRAEKVPDDVLLYAATLAAKHSAAKDVSKVEVDYTLVKYVHKEAGSKPGMVVYTDYSSIIVK